MGQIEQKSDFDYLNVFAELTEAQENWRQVANSVVSKYLQPGVSEAFDKNHFDRDIPQILGSHSLIGPHVWTDSGDLADPIASGLIMRELERCDSSYRSFASVQGSLVMYPIKKYGSDSQKEKWLPNLAAGKSIGGFALTEPQGGSDPSNMQTVLTKSEEGLRLRGKKRWVTNGPIADVIVVWARGEDGIQGVLLPTDRPGIKIRKIDRKLSLCISESSEIEFDDVLLEDVDCLPGANSIGKALDCLNQARYGIIWGVLGAAESCLVETLNYCDERKLFKKKLSGFQLVQAKLSDCCLKLTQGQLLAMQLGRLKSSKAGIAPHEVSIGKQGNVHMALEVARTCRDILGANGVLLDFHSMRHMVNLETVFTYEGAHDIHRLIVGLNMTGENAFAN
ncbi:MAG: acyl-CoA dehydrogenase family protein [Pseudobacteriovorax sp.]|nr:acyl-CoA dehydrogenase family protein [Pseudobacteriovorax sp.]